MIGYPDRPIEHKEDNNFGTDTYVDVLSDFILSCETPMTIAIQGDWGTGKTSMMNMIRETITGRGGDRIVDVWFNTWQYSQFNLGDQLPLLLLNKMVDSISSGDSRGSELKSMVKKGVKLMSQIGVGIASQGTASVDFGEFNMDEIEQLVNIRGKFEKSIRDRLDGKGEGARLVVFVDDLDRLQPEKAVEVLETMKIFLDCERCVFVLAVDYDVVARGVKAKYGDTISDEKGKSFFDKIIQLPFKMPVAKYDIDSYLKKLMSTIWGTSETDERDNIADYRKIIEQSIGKNPRSIKRAVNSFTIINNVAEREHKLSADSEMLKQQRKVLFVLLCMQLSFEQLYTFILGKSDEIAENSMKAIRELENDDDSLTAVLTDIYKEEISADSDLFRSNRAMLSLFTEWGEDLLKEAGHAGVSDALGDILSLSAITASDTRGIQTKPGRNYDKIAFNGGMYSKAQLPRAVVEYYVAHNRIKTLQDLQDLQEKFRWDSVTYGVIRRASDLYYDRKYVGKYYAKDPIHIASLDIDIMVWSSWSASRKFDEYKKKIFKLVKWDKYGFYA